MGEQLPPGVGLKHSLAGNQLTLDLMHDSEWEPKRQAKPPRIVMAHGSNAAGAHELAWERLAPGHYQASVTLTEGEMVRGAVQLGGTTLSFGPTLLGSSTEWAFDETRADELRRTAVTSGGRELLDLSQAWRSPQIVRFADMQSPLLLAALVLMLIEALVTRIGWQMPKWAFAGWRKQTRETKPTREMKQHQERLKERLVKKKAEVSTAESKPTPPTPEVDRESRFARAKKK
jgi:hypothetical protein